MRRTWPLLTLVAAAGIAALAWNRAADRQGRAAHGQREARERAAQGAAPTNDAPAAAGVVLDAETGAPVAGARVTLYRLPLDSPKAPLVSTYVTDDAGRFSVPLPQPDDATRLVIDAEGYPPQASWFDREGPEIRLERGAERTFTIVDDEGRPAAGAEVGLYADWRLKLAAVEADAHGIATARIAQGVSVLVRFPGHAYEDLPRSERLFVLSPGFSIGGRVVDSAGAPVSQAFVHLRQGSGGCKDVSGYAPTAATGPDGRFVFHGIHGSMPELTVRAEGYGESVRGAVPGDEEVRIVLLRPGSVSGTVVLPDGTPAPGARVHPEVPYDHDQIAQADGEGRFRIDDLDPDTRKVHAFADPDLVGSAGVAPPEGGATEGVRIVLRPRDRSYVRVRVVDERGRPVPGVRVIRHFWRALAVTDADGLATVTLDDPEIELTLHLVPDGEKPPLLCESEFETRSASSPDAAPVVQVLREAVLIRLDARAPGGSRLPDASATFHGGHADEADDEEAWLLDPAATYRIRVWAPGHLDTVIDGWTFETEGATVVATLRPCAAVKGRVVDASGFPVAAITAKFDATLATNDGTRVDLACDPGGAFLLEGLGEGSGRLVFSRKPEGPPEAGVEIRTWSGRVTDVGTLTLVRPVTVTGRVVDSAGRPLGGAQIGMVGIPDYWHQTYSHADGTFRAKVPSFSRGDLVVRKGRFGTVRTTVEPGSARALGDIVLPAPGALEVEAEGIDWKRVDLATIEVAWPGSATVESVPCWEYELRPCRIDDLAPGRYLVRLIVGDVTLQDEVQVAAGETAKLAFRLR